ncbi:MAG TPA: hypothetical protein VIG49_12585 [Acetobacteraceae bacterium]
MRTALLTAAMASVLAGAAFAQPATPSQPVAPYTSPYATGARPGNDVGTGMSLPMGHRASNIDNADTRSDIAPNLPAPGLGQDASTSSYLRAAQASLAAGRTGEAQQSLEMAQTRMLDRAVPLGQTNNPSDNPTVKQISEALHALAAGDRASCMQSIQAAITTATAQAN